MMESCPACGLPVDERYVADPPLSGIKLRIYNLVRARPGITSDELADMVYAGYLNVGPDSGRKVIHVHINQINRCLRSIGSQVRIRGSRYYGYRVIREPKRKKETENGKRNRETGA